jgi:hypothetical protein
MKTLKIEYLILPPNGSHIQEFLYRVIGRGKVFNTWSKGELPRLGFYNNGSAAEITNFGHKLSSILPSLKRDKIKVYECKIVRKECLKK